MQALCRVGRFMREEINREMDRGGIADITTTGRKTGLPRRIEIYFHQFDGDYYLTGRPGRRRDWEANIEADPDFVLHLKGDVKADIPVRGETEPDPEVRGQVLRRALIESWDSPPEGVDKALHKWVENSPFIRFRPI